MSKEKFKAISQLIAFVALLLPLILYVYKFGTSLSSNHQTWAEFGSSMSGIYSPIFAFLALLVLINQTKSQYSINKHKYDQAYVQENRNEINFYIQKLELYLDKNYNDTCTINEFIQQEFAKVTNATLNDKVMTDSINSFNKEHKKIFDIWLAIYPLLLGLDSQKEYPYKHNFASAKLRLISCLQYGTCVALDNIYYVVSNDIQKGKYYFKDMK